MEKGVAAKFDLEKKTIPNQSNVKFRFGSVRTSYSGLFLGGAMVSTAGHQFEIVDHFVYLEALIRIQTLYSISRFTLNNKDPYMLSEISKTSFVHHHLF